MKLSDIDLSEGALALMLDAVKNSREYKFPSLKVYNSFCQRMYFARGEFISRKPDLALKLGFEFVPTKNGDGTVNVLMQRRLNEVERYLVKGKSLEECIADMGVMLSEKDTPTEPEPIQSLVEDGPGSADILGSLFNDKG